MLSFCLWILPLAMIPISFLISRLLPFKKIRYTLYALLFIAAFFLDLFNLTWKNDSFDNYWRIIILFAVWDIVWNFLKLKNKKFAFVMIILIFIGHLIINWKMLFTPINTITHFWYPQTISTYVRHHEKWHQTYILKAHDNLNRKKPSRTVILTRHINKIPLEKTIDFFITQEGYYQTKFSAQWRKTNEGVRCELVDNGTTIWALGEGL